MALSPAQRGGVPGRRLPESGSARGDAQVSRAPRRWRPAPSKFDGSSHAAKPARTRGHSASVMEKPRRVAGAALHHHGVAEDALEGEAEPQRAAARDGRVEGCRISTRSVGSRARRRRGPIVSAMASVAAGRPLPQLRAEVEVADLDHAVAGIDPEIRGDRGPSPLAGSRIAWNSGSSLACCVARRARGVLRSPASRRRDRSSRACRGRRCRWREERVPRAAAASRGTSRQVPALHRRAGRTRARPVRQGRANGLAEAVEARAHSPLRSATSPARPASPSARSPAMTPCRSASGLFWLIFHFPSIRVIGISMPRIPRTCAATNGRRRVRDRPRLGPGAPHAER